jgi:hypothetical protein
MEGALISEFLMVAVPLIKRMPPAIEMKQVGRRPISFELKALALLIKAWHDLTYEGTSCLLYVFNSKLPYEPLQNWGICCLRHQ